MIIFSVQMLFLAWSDSTSAHSDGMGAIELRGDVVYKPQLYPNPNLMIWFDINVFKIGG